MLTRAANRERSDGIAVLEHVIDDTRVYRQRLRLRVVELGVVKASFDQDRYRSKHGGTAFWRGIIAIPSDHRQSPRPALLLVLSIGLQRTETEDGDDQGRDCCHSSKRAIAI